MSLAIVFYVLEFFLLFSAKGGWGYPFAEYSAKLINLYFEPFPYLIPLYLSAQPRLVESSLGLGWGNSLLFWVGGWLAGLVVVGGLVTHCNLIILSYNCQWHKCSVDKCWLDKLICDRFTSDGFDFEVFLKVFELVTGLKVSLKWNWSWI